MLVKLIDFNGMPTFPRVILYLEVRELHVDIFIFLCSFLSVFFFFFAHSSVLLQRLNLTRTITPIQSGTGSNGNKVALDTP